MSRPARHEPGGSGLLRAASRSMFWNALLLPLIAVLNLLANIFLRREFQLDSGYYDAGLGLMNAILVYGGLGLAVTIPQFVPALRARFGRPGVARFLRRVWGLRLVALVVVLVPLNLFADRITAQFPLGPEAVLVLRLISALVAARALVELAVKSQQALLAHLSANVLQLLQTIASAGAVVVALWLGADIAGIFEAMALGGLLVAAVALAVTARSVARLPTEGDAGHASAPAPEGGASGEVETGKLWRFASFMYTYDIFYLCSMPAFAAPALAAVVSAPGPVALFVTAFQIPREVVVVLISGFQGLYRPLFATVLDDPDRGRLRTAFREVTKVQILLLLPAGAGLVILLGDLVPLLFLEAFVEAVPLARILCAFLFLESMLNLGIIILSTDHRYRTVLWAQSIRVLTAPLFLLLAAAGNLVLATWVFAAGRLGAMLWAHLAARRRYGLRFPWAFAARVAAPTGVMTVAVMTARAWLTPGWGSVLLVSGGGAVLFALLARWWRLLGAREADLLRRAGFPGSRFLLAWLAPPR